MPRKKTGTVWAKVTLLRLSADTDGRLRRTAQGLQLDVSNLMRLILAEHLPEYEARARKAASGVEENPTPPGEGP